MRMIPMRTFYLMLVIVFSCQVEFVWAQVRSISPQEYIQSTSPLRDGGSVTSRSMPGRGVQTVTTIAQLPSINQRQSAVTAGFEPRIANSAANASVPFAGTSPNTTGQIYPYPAQARPTGFRASNPTSYRPGLVSTQSNYTAFRQTNTLGLESTGLPAARLAQNCQNCTPNSIYGSGAAYQPPSLNGGVPDINIQVPGQIAPQPIYPQGNYQMPGTIGTPQYGAQGANWYTPFVTGSGVYSPLINFRNMPPGTYLGQGIIGQPTAYVDGQPVRNLLRYISP